MYQTLRNFSLNDTVALS